MLPEFISHRVILDRLEWVKRMVATIQNLPLADKEAFFADDRNTWTADSCLRRALEALFDLGRHILAKGFGTATTEYKEIAKKLHQHAVLSNEDATLLTTLAGYRNRLVHFYHEVGAEELYEVCATHLADIQHIAAAYRQWIVAHPDKIDKTL